MLQVNLSVEAGNISSLYLLANEDNPCWKGWMPSRHVLFQVANAILLLGYLCPEGTYGVLLLHSLLVLGFLLMSTWSWIILCAPDVFSWNFSFTFINLVQLLFIIYHLRPVKFSRELEDVYTTLFQPMRLSRGLFKKLISAEHATVLTLQEGDAYATQNVTRTDRLGLLISGVVTVIANNQFLHNIKEKEFLDSPEFESTTSGDEKFRVSLVATERSRYIVWQRSALKYLLIKEPHLALVMSTIIGRDVTNKLYTINNKVMMADGSHVDIRLPTVNTFKLAEQEGMSLSAISFENKDDPYQGNVTTRNVQAECCLDEEW